MHSAIGIAITEASLRARDFMGHGKNIPKLREKKEEQMEVYHLRKHRCFKRHKFGHRCKELKGKYEAFSKLPER